MPGKSQSVLAVAYFLAVSVVLVSSPTLHAENCEGSTDHIPDDKKTMVLVNEVSPTQASNHNLSEILQSGTFDNEATSECAVCTLRHRRLLQDSKGFSE